MAQLFGMVPAPTRSLPLYSLHSAVPNMVLYPSKCSWSFLSPLCSLTCSPFSFHSSSVFTTCFITEFRSSLPDTGRWVIISWEKTYCLGQHRWQISLACGYKCQALLALEVPPLPEEGLCWVGSLTTAISPPPPASLSMSFG